VHARFINNWIANRRFCCATGAHSIACTTGDSIVSRIARYEVARFSVNAIDVKRRKFKQWRTSSGDALQRFWWSGAVKM